MVDYSKWDALELSDDSDVEVHPNVDKNSFVRWKQRDIHEKRAQRENEIKGLKIQKEMYTALNSRMDQLVKEISDDAIVTEDGRNDFISKTFNSKEKCTLEADDQAPTYNEMMEDLFTQIESDLKKDGQSISSANIKAKLAEHRLKTESVLKQIDPKIEEITLEKNKHITSDDIHEGWNSSFINKKPTESKPTTATNKTTTIETLNSPVKSKPASTSKSTTSTSTTTIKPSKPISELGELELLPETIEFSKINNLKESCNFIISHSFIACTHQKDALLMKSFDYQLADDTELAASTIEKGILLQFASDILENAPDPNMPMAMRLEYIKRLFGQLEIENSPSRNAYEQECGRMIEHVKTRCKIIKAEQEKEGDDGDEEGDDHLVEQIQLRSMDPDTKLVVNIPEKGTDEYKIYEELPDAMKDALNTGSLDEVNKVFATMPVEEAELLLEKFNESGVIGIQALLENEEQFKELTENQQKFDQMKEAAEKINLNDKLNELV